MIILVSLLGAAAADAQAIRKWQTPQGGLYFGDRPPAGSTLLETIDDSSVAGETADGAVSQDDAMAQAAAEGREIMKRRGAEREAERAREEALLQADERRHSPDIVVISAPTHVFFGRHRFDRFGFFEDHPILLTDPSPRPAASISPEAPRPATRSGAPAAASRSARLFVSRNAPR